MHIVAPMNDLPTNMQIASARLPATYEQAKVALASCASIDECRDWANKSEALASYAKMADDDSLRTLADRIQARAVRRMGELLKQFDGRGGDQSKRDATVLSAPTQTEAARAAGISERQQKTAVRVANVPQEKFDAAIEQPKPATVTQLAEMGKQTRSAPIEVRPVQPSEVAHLANGLRVALAGLDPILDRIAQIGVDAFWREADQRVRNQVDGTAQFLQVLSATSTAQHRPGHQTEQPRAAS